MKKTKIVFAVIFTASVGLAIVAACLGNSILSLMISVLSVLYLVCFILSEIAIDLSRIVSLHEMEAMSKVYQVISKVAADQALADSISKSSKEALENLRERIERNEEAKDNCKSPASEEEQKEPTTEEK